jgi:ureidoacrylate peracid hydrolase
MHRYVISDATKQRLLRRQGRLTGQERFDARSTALLIIDMQNHFVAEGAPGEVPLARQIVPVINRLAGAVRACGAAVVWIQTTSGGALEHWSNYHQHMLTPERRTMRLESLDESGAGFDIYPALDVLPTDLRIKKMKYSAFIPGSSDLDPMLKSRRIDTLLIAGTATNVCCESTARDAMMLDYRVTMLSDATATWTDQEHAATLDSFLLFFGDVMGTDEAIGRLIPSRIASSIAEDIAPSVSGPRI